ncbi:MAG: sigma-70 family RNA polymerase sigma factor [Oscillospiraceae bacterium]|nr:sigma-70 family RNA polymerase sigma factor [Oscillospiraceae bacterium]
MKLEFEALYKEYFSRTYAFLYKLTEQRDLAEELTQETFYQAFVSFHRFRGDSDVFTWLASIAKHTYYRYLRKNKHLIDSISTDLIADLYYHDDGEQLEDTVERQLLLDSTRKAMQSLPDKYRDVMVLRIYADMSYAEIGKSLHISENSARVIYHRAKKMILEAIANEHDL